MTRALLQQALDALEGTNLALHYAAIAALREALAQPAPEPVATTYWGDDGYEHKERRTRSREGDDPRIDHLFNGFDNMIHNADDYSGGYLRAMRQEFGELMRDATPPAAPAPVVREPLTDEQLEEIVAATGHGSALFDFARAIEQAHGIGTTGGSNG